MIKIGKMVPEIKMTKIKINLKNQKNIEFYDIYDDISRILLFLSNLRYIKVFYEVLSIFEKSLFVLKIYNIN